MMALLGIVSKMLEMSNGERLVRGIRSNNKRCMLRKGDLGCFSWVKLERPLKYKRLIKDRAYKIRKNYQRFLVCQQIYRVE